MAINYTNNNGIVTITFTYTAAKAKVDATLEDIGLYWNGLGYGGIWANLTNQQRLDIVDEAVKRQLIEWAATQNLQAQIATARANATTENGTKYLP